jgi:hypothetical protein
MAERTLTLEEKDRLNTLLTQAGGIAGIATNQQGGDFIEALRNAMWCVSDLLREAKTIINKEVNHV